MRHIIGPGLASRFHWQWHDPGKKNALNRPYVAVAAYRELVRGNTTQRTAETGSLRTPPTAKQSGQSRQGGDEGRFSP